jgi:HK97 family phage prohead protease
MLGDEFSSENLWLAEVPITRAAEEGDDGERAIYGLASTGNPDRMGTNIDQASLGRAARRYLKRNGKLFYNHNWAVPIGRATDVNVRDDGLYVRGTIGSGYSVPMSVGMLGASSVGVDDIWSMIRQGILTSYSIGFDGKPDPEDKDGKRILVNDLYEVSVVSIPANPDAEFAVTRALESFSWGPLATAIAASRKASGVWLLDEPSAAAAEEEEEGRSGESLDFAAVMEELKQCRQFRLIPTTS